MFLVLGTGVVHAAGGLGTEVVLEVGQDFRLPAGATVRAEESQILKVKPVGSSFQVLGLKPGWASLVVNNQGVEVSVLSKAQAKTRRTLREWVRPRLGLEERVERGEVLLSGRLLRAPYWIDLHKVCADCDYRARLTMGEEVETAVRKDLAGLFKKRGLGLPALRWTPDATWVVRGKKPPSALLRLAKSLGIEVGSEDEAVDLSPLVRTQIFVLEARRSKTRQWGLKWPQSVTAQLLPKSSDPFSTLSVTAVALENQGDAKILANPTLLCRSGEEAEFLAGGEFPIKVVSTRMQDVIWKRYGVLLKVKPRADRFGRMNLSLETEISSIDGSRTVDGIPALFTSRVLSHFDLAEPRTIAISGLIKNEESRALEGVPGLAGLPVLGHLFSSRDFRENRSELLILVRPSLVDPSKEKEVL